MKFLILSSWFLLLLSPIGTFAQEDLPSEQREREGEELLDSTNSPSLLRAQAELGLDPALPLEGATRAPTKTQMIFEKDVAPDLKAVLTVVDELSSREKILKDFEKAALHARDVLDRLDPLDPASEITKLVSQKTKGSYIVSPDLAKILHTAGEVAARLKEPLAKKISVNLDKNEVHLKSAEVLINMEPLLKGYLADVIAADLSQAGFQNLFLELEGVFISRGQDFNGPWKISVMDLTSEMAQHAFVYKVFNTAAATVSFLNRELASIPSDLKSVTVFTEEGACKAQGLASAAYVAGLTNAKKILKVSGVLRFVLVDQEGRFVQIP